MEAPETRYIAVGDADVAYQVLGHGPIDLLFCYGLGSHLEHYWDDLPGWELLSDLASFTRLILFDRRGTGASDGVPRNATPTWEEWAEDLGAVLDAVGSRQAAIMATLEAGAIAILFAAMHPERVKALILISTGAKYERDEDYPIGVAPQVTDTFVEWVAQSWGTLEFQAAIVPSLAHDRAALMRLARMVRASATPRSAAAQYRYIMKTLDVRKALPLIQAPTLIAHVRDNPLVPIQFGHYLAEHVAGARFVELPGADLAVADVRSLVAEFLTGEHMDFEIERVLTTVLFTDIVASTQHAASLGDREWRAVLDEHDRIVREQLRRFRGHEIKTMGDGFLASFDGPARAIRCAEALGDATSSLNVKLRMGLHTGECEVRGDDLGGLAVHIAARIGALAGVGEVLVSSTVKDLVIGSGIDFADRGEHELKGVPGSWRLFAVKA
jgi:class 3 adenylate cyclase/alpha-beta hydrolase superfamily lysophospholipase